MRGNAGAGWTVEGETQAERTVPMIQDPNPNDQSTENQNEEELEEAQAEAAEEREEEGGYQ